MKSRMLFLCALVMAPLMTAPAQSEGDLRAWVALDASPIGALTPLLSPAMVGRHLRSAQLGIRYGFSSDNDVTSHAVAAEDAGSRGCSRRTSALTRSASARR